jgi:hypothetical protein
MAYNFCQSKANKGQIIATVLIILIVFIAEFIFAKHNYGYTNVIFKDSNIESAVRKIIRKPKGAIYRKDVINIKSIKNIQKADSLKGIEYCRNLETLQILDHYHIYQNLQT